MSQNRHAATAGYSVMSATFSYSREPIGAWDRRRHRPALVVVRHQARMPNDARWRGGRLFSTPGVACECSGGAVGLWRCADHLIHLGLERQSANRGGQVSPRTAQQLQTCSVPTWVGRRRPKRDGQRRVGHAATGMDDPTLASRRMPAYTNSHGTRAEPMIIRGAQ